jgi:transcriptional regulator with XRE-family HTH domain
MLDSLSNMMDNNPSDLNQRIAQRVLALRTAQGMALQTLAERCGVSRSMISVIERGQSSPTAVVLEKLATGLGVTLASLFDAPASPAAPPSPLSRLADQSLWRDPASGYVRRQVSPPGFATPMQIVEVEFPPGAQVTYDNGAQARRVHQQVWVLAGHIDVTGNGQTWSLKAGDCLAMDLDHPTSYHNRSPEPARYAVVLSNPAFNPS